MSKIDSVHSDFLQRGADSQDSQLLSWPPLNPAFPLAMVALHDSGCHDIRIQFSSVRPGKVRQPTSSWSSLSISHSLVSLVAHRYGLWDQSSPIRRKHYLNNTKLYHPHWMDWFSKAIPFIPITKLPSAARLGTLKWEPSASQSSFPTDWATAVWLNSTGYNKTVTSNLLGGHLLRFFFFSKD